jgi:hypothetical protein
VNRIELEVRAIVPDAMHFLRPGEHPLRAVTQHRLVFPAALPQLVDDLHVFFGDLVARVVLRLSRISHTLGGAVQIAGDDVPADAPAGQMVECRKPARQCVRMFVRDRASNPEAQISGDVSHRRDQQQRIVHRHLHRLRDRRIGRPSVDVVDAEHIGEEQRVEFAPLEEPRQLDPVVERIIAVGPITRVRPQTGRLMRDTVHVEGIETNLPGHQVFLAPAGRGTYTIGDYDRGNGITTQWMRMSCVRCRRR